MKKNLMVLILGIFVFLSWISCAPQIKDLKATGDTAEIVFRDSRKISGEFLALTDSGIFVLKKGSDWPSIYYGEIFEIDLHDLKSIAIKGYVNKEWVGALVAFEVIPAVLFGIAAASAGADVGQALGIMSLPVLLNVVAFSASTPPAPAAKFPSSTDQLKTLSKYARFPQGLTWDQLKQLLENSKQDEIHHFK
jgi:hypothetical protein